MKYLRLQADVSLLDSLWKKRDDLRMELSKYQEEAETLEAEMPNRASLAMLKMQLERAEEKHRSIIDRGAQLQEMRRKRQELTAEVMDEL